MTEIAIDIDFKQLTIYQETKAKHYARKIRKAVEKGNAKSAKFMQDAVKRETPVDTGKLRRGWKAKVHAYTWSLENKVPYGFYVHEGTRAHIILPVRKKALWWEGADHPVRMVRHPGTRPNPFVARTFRKHEKEAVGIMNKEVQRAIN